MLLTKKKNSYSVWFQFIQWIDHKLQSPCGITQNWSQLTIYRLSIAPVQCVPADCCKNVNSTEKKFVLKSSVGKLDVAIEGPKSGDNLVLHVLNALYFALHAHPSANSDVQVPRVRDYQVLLSKISSANLIPFIIFIMVMGSTKTALKFEYEI